MISEAEGLVAGHGPLTRRATERIYGFLVDAHSCRPYVKTIYIGFEINGELVAALYPNAEHVEIAMALPESAEDPILIDATHLTWKTLPVAAVVRSTDDLDRTLDLLVDAVSAVTSGTHSVNRPNDHFIGRRRRLTHDPKAQPDH